VGEGGLLLTSGDPLPDPDGGPRAIVPVDWKLVLPDGETAAAELVGGDRDLNLAFLRVDPGALAGAEPVSFARARDPEVGEGVLVLAPLPVALGRTVAYHRNEIVALLDEELGMAVLDRPLDDLEIGGLVVGEDGRPLGVVGERATEGGGEPELKPYGFLRLLGSMQQGPVGGYPVLFLAETLLPLIADPPALESTGSSPRGWLGVTMQPLSEDLAEYWGIESEGGVIFGAVVEDSPAWQAGLRPGDVMTSLDGHPLAIRSVRELPEVRRRVLRAGPGARLDLVYWREGEARHTTVELGVSPATVQTAERFESEVFGISARELTYDLRQRFNLSEEVRGVIVEGVSRGGWAAIAGVRPGDLVLRVGERETSDLEALRTALERAEQEQVPEVLLLLQRQFRTFFVPVPTEWKK
jgi:serine protease Do